MAVKLRLRRVGATKRPSYRVVVADSRAPRNGRFVETLGHYNPLTSPATIKMDAERVNHWLTRGAQPSDAVARLLRKSGLIPAVPTVEAARGEDAPDTHPA
jgi:small subunit ribosomal protein S16